jgi:hypothetical protein
VHGVSSYQGWKYAWPQHVEMYRKRKTTKTDTSVDTEKIKEQIKQELAAEMRMQNMQMQRWCCQQCPIVQSCKPFTRHIEEQLCVRRYRFDRWHYRVGCGSAL